MNPLKIDQPCLTIANNEVLFEQYKIALKREKDTINIDGEDAIDSNRIFFWFHSKHVWSSKSIMWDGKSLLIDAILTYHLRKESDKDNSSETSPSRKDSSN